MTDYETSDFNDERDMTEANEAIRRALATPEFVEQTLRPGGSVLVRGEDGVVRIIGDER